MKKFVEKANLPRDAEAVLIGERYRAALGRPLLALGVEPVYVPDNPCVDARMAGHADLSLLHVGGARLFAAPYLRGSALEGELEQAGAELIYPDIEQRADYPHDAQLNICILGERYICGAKTAAKDIDDYLTNSRMSTIRYRQGYARCSVCAVGEGGIITADEGIYRAASEAGIDALKITPGYFELSGFDYGFIGGSCFKIAEDKLAFTGRIDMHPDKQKILDFLQKHGVQALFLTDLRAFDIGSAIPIFEK